MKIQELKIERRKQIHEYLTTTHMFCLFIMMFAMALSEKMFSPTNYNTTGIRFLLFFASILLGLILITIYNTKNASLTVEARFSWVDFLYISFPLAVAAFTLFISGTNANHTEVILLLPTIITASLMGKRAGLIMATVCTGIIYIHNVITGPTSDLVVILETNLILISVLFIMAWFTGAQTDLDSQTRRELTRLAGTDLLTGLYNYAYLQEKISEYFLTASETHPLAMIILDIDYFKHYNDIHGHQTGDLLLMMIADILSEKVNHRGFAARYGGDEFVIVLPGTDSATAVKIAEDIREELRAQHFPGEVYQPEGRLTISCGIAECPLQARNARDLFKYADQALYRAKSLNKNKVEMYYSVFDSLEMKDDEKNLLNSIRTLVSVINAKDRYTYGHSERVTNHSLSLAKILDLPEDQMRLLGYAAFLHDIGKIEIDRDVLNKAGSLTLEEWDVLKQHSRWGSEIVKAVPQLYPIVPIILHHHENFDGSGYPAGLQGKEIPILARIIRVTDSYDSMISHRPYKQNLSILAAIEELKANAGTQFDPELVSHFLNIIEEEAAAQDDTIG
ncbi:MAG TPA: diguanylate cyclase [Syntrophomonadaceae bacterium]|nr:diguanylate cyclase [Syntrophomonadaceae bacterium]